MLLNGVLRWQQVDDDEEEEEEEDTRVEVREKILSGWLVNSLREAVEHGGWFRSSASRAAGLSQRRMLLRFLREWEEEARRSTSSPSFPVEVDGMDQLDVLLWARR